MTIQLERTLEESCPECGKNPIVCSVNYVPSNVPGGDDTISFTHKCPICSYSESESLTIGHDQETTNSYDCSFCNHNWLEEILNANKPK